MLCVCENPENENNKNPTMCSTGSVLEASYHLKVHDVDFKLASSVSG